MNTNTWNMSILIFNAFLWIVTTLFYYKKTKNIIGTGLLLMYTSISIVSIHLFYNPYAKGMFLDLQFLPYLYLYVMIMVVSSPILIMKDTDAIIIQKPSSQIFNIVCVAIVLLSCSNIVSDFQEIKMGLVMLVLDQDYGANAYSATVASYTNSVSDNDYHIFGILSNIAKSLAPVFMAYYLTLTKKNLFIMCGLIFASLILPLINIARGGRGDMAMFIINMSFLFLFLRNSFPSTLRRRIRFIVLFIGILFLTLFSILTISRSQGDWEKSIFSVERYWGESFLRFNNFGLNANGTRNGDYTAILPKKIIGLETADSYLDRISKYSYMKMDESVFYTFVGDFTLDYGPIVAFVIFVCTALFFNYVLKIKYRKMYFYQYLLFYLLLVGLLGFFQFPLGRINGNLQMFALICLAFLFKLDQYLRTKKYDSPK